MNKLMDFPYTHILVLGLAKSGTAAAHLLLANEKKVRVNDMKTKENDAIVTELKMMGAEVIVGSHPVSVLEDIEIIVKNPGIPYDNSILTEAVRRDIPIITEIELAGQLVEGSIIGITGSNGKTTTTTLTTEILRESKHPVKVAGNIGLVATEVAQTLAENESLVLELSSFQLLGIEKFKPKIAVLLNIFEAHLDYHKTMENYKEAKFNLFKNQTEDDYLIYNADDLQIVEAVKQASSKKIPFSINKRLEKGIWANDESIFFKDEKIIDRKDIVLVGAHNLENILASIAAAKLCGANNDGIYKVLTTFTGVKHRLQFVDNINDRLFYNDSKATNVLATQKALSSFEQETILLAGGLDRGNEFGDLLPFLQHVKAMITFGETKEKLKKIAEEANIETIILTKDIEDAVRKAYSVSAANDVILLSPACASWDQYRTFEERGDMFIKAVHKLL
ncbi:UDP-N-acetylmuramoyl-L-alanine--D-glutamate ligase [Virgibacillus profundi]|uniref:UDP-N-acetylmuramoylalanine--D-glutamate ligase n=1 Tax=Virgibacillus profundi TaxID=2024555 RepID=A0A2A2IFK7_9BACI|nr:UDP-N-acetylmuramoyl-L-alanine--D-glutamate ligase [Virgibacillus profundi]PAV29915.1 UDP-N-acetylmuramoyl-L-alanine--D-glutamate ligase [Virgibacillus profundi]PXY54087.1 UDP-N-acetylmuramoyl-L-alanine--D-glutamate ligase [Virgibacillus profundi]